MDETLRKSLYFDSSDEEHVLAYQFLAKIRGYQTAFVTTAIKKLLEQNNLSLEDVNWMERNDAVLLTKKYCRSTSTPQAAQTSLTAAENEILKKLTALFSNQQGTYMPEDNSHAKETAKKNNVPVRAKKAEPKIEVLDSAKKETEKDQTSAPPARVADFDVPIKGNAENTDWGDDWDQEKDASTVENIPEQKAYSKPSNSKKATSSDIQKLMEELATFN